MTHAGLQPALGDRKKPCACARGKGLVDSVHRAGFALVLSALNRKRGSESAAVGSVCRGRDDELAHGYGVICNLVQSKTAGWSGPRDHRVTHGNALSSQSNASVSRSLHATAVGASGRPRQASGRMSHIALYHSNTELLIFIIFGIKSELPCELRRMTPQTPSLTT